MGDTALENNMIDDEQEKVSATVLIIVNDKTNYFVLPP